MHEPEPFLIAEKKQSQWLFRGTESFAHGNDETHEWWGEFRASWHLKDAKIRIHTDQHGLLPLYYYQSAGIFAVSSSWVTLQQELSLSNYNDAAIACFLHTGQYFGNDTPFAGLFRTPPGSTIIWQNDHLDVRSIETPPPQESSLSRTAAVKQYGEVFEAAIRATSTEISSRAILLLSGGQDSRHTLFALDATHRQPATVATQNSVHGRVTVDTDIAKALCRACNTPHTVIPAERRPGDAEIQKNRQLELSSSYHAWLRPLVNWLDEQPAEAIWDGLAGDALSASRFLTQDWIRYYEQRNWTALAEKYLPPSGRIQSLLKPSHRSRWNRDTALARIAVELASTPECPNPQGLFNLRNRTRRSIAPILWPAMGRKKNILLPYLHPDVFAFLQSLPMPMLLDRGFHREAIMTRYPQHAHIPFDDAVRSKFSRKLMPSEKLAQAIDWARAPLRIGLTDGVNSKYLLAQTLRGILHNDNNALLEECICPALYISQLEALRKS